MYPVFVASILAAGLSFGPSVNAAEIVLGADPWCPYNCEPGSDTPGFMIEVAREAFAMYGHTVVYENAPWARVLEMAQTGRIAGAVGSVPDEAPDLHYGIPLGSYSDAVAVRRGQTIDPDDPATFAGWRVAAIDGYDYYGPIAEYIAVHQENRALVQYAGGDRPLRTNLRKLRAGRVDMVAEAYAVLAYELMQSGSSAEIDIVRTSTSDAIYIGFSPELPEAPLYIAQLESGVAALRASGRLTEILSRYGIPDWIE